MNNRIQPQEQAINPFDIFIVAVSLLSIINIPLYLLISDETLSYVIRSVDVLLSLFFLTDFVRRYRRSDSKTNYFFRGMAGLIYYRVFRCRSLAS
jgi:hypothetical protein